MPWIHYTNFGRSTSRYSPINQAWMLWIPLHQIWQIHWQIYRTHQSSIDALNTITPNLADLPHPSIEAWDALNIITPNLANLLADLPHPSIKHRCLEYHYTKTWQIYPTHQSSIDALNTITPNQIYWQIYSTHQSSIDALNTITLKFSSSTSRSTPPINWA